MKKCRLAGLLVVCVLTAAPKVRADGDESPLFRVFLKDGGSLVSYGELARRELADWPATHFNYKQDEIRQMLLVLDEAIAELRAAAGIGQFNLNFVAAPAAPPPPTREPLLPAPTPKEVIEQTLLAARLTPSPAERTSLMAVALSNIDCNAA